MSRKTCSIKTLKDSANEMLAGWSQSADERLGIIRMLELALHATDNYAGYQNLTFNQIDKEAFRCRDYFASKGQDVDVRPGSRWHIGERMVKGVDTWHEDVDDTRRVYY